MSWTSYVQVQDNIKMDFQQGLDSVVWINMVHVKYQWRTPVNMVINLSKNSRETFQNLWLYIDCLNKTSLLKNDSSSWNW
jgi:hypothetical protein